MLNALKEEGLKENTLVVFVSDNGPILDDGYADGAVSMLGKHMTGGLLEEINIVLLKRKFAFQLFYIGLEE